MELQISIKDENADLFLQILKSFKDDMINKIKILDNNYISYEEQKEIEEMLNSRSKKDKEIAFSKTIKEKNRSQKSVFNNFLKTHIDIDNLKNHSRDELHVR